jgi:hypothetical protein
MTRPEGCEEWDRWDAWDLRGRHDALREDAKRVTRQEEILGLENSRPEGFPV